MGVRDFFIKAKVRYDRGKSYFSKVDDIFAILVLVGVYQLNFTWFFILVFVLVSSIIIIGIVDYKWGIWLQEQEYHTITLNPAFARMDKRIKEMHTYLKYCYLKETKKAVRKWAVRQ